ncbi:hypothetical protein AOLI_G00314290 [Acnodon oligacanthus]
MLLPGKREVRVFCGRFSGSCTAVTRLSPDNALDLGQRSQQLGGPCGGSRLDGPRSGREETRCQMDGAAATMFVLPVITSQSTGTALSFCPMGSFLNGEPTTAAIKRSSSESSTALEA